MALSSLLSGACWGDLHAVEIHPPIGTEPQHGSTGSETDLPGEQVCLCHGYAQGERASSQIGGEYGTARFRTGGIARRQKPGGVPAGFPGDEHTVLTGGSHTQPGHFLLHGHLPFFYP